MLQESVDDAADCSAILGTAEPFRRQMVDGQGRPITVHYSIPSPSSFTSGR